MSSLTFSNLYKQSISIFVSISLVSSQIVLASETMAPIVIDSTLQSNNPTLTQSNSGIDIVNISTPNQAGISNNYFKELNVSQQGLIFNNAKDLMSNTQLAGWIASNPHLKEHSAKLILNQITSHHTSQLLGFMEIAGKQAEFILANPNGITCNGCGFINASSATLSTGSISLEEINRLNDFKDLNQRLHMIVQRGHINIEALNTSNIPLLNIIAQSMKVNGDVLANKLNLILGKNDVAFDIKNNASILLYEPITISKGETNSNNSDNKKDTSDSDTALALDVEYLGSILAKSIYLVATEEGIGVKNSGQIASIASDRDGDGGFVIDVNGRVEISQPKEAIKDYLASKQKQQQLQAISKLTEVERDEKLNALRELDAIDTLEKPTKPLYDLNSSTAYKTTDAPSESFVPPAILAYGDIHIKAKELLNRSIVSAQGDIFIQADRVENIGSLELENMEISRIHHNESSGSEKKYTIYNYDTIITEEKLKDNTFNPAMMTAANISIQADSLLNDTAILYATHNVRLDVQDIVNTVPTPKKTERREGTMTMYDRHGDCTPILSWFSNDVFCKTGIVGYHPYYPAPSVSSVPLLLPSIDTQAILNAHQDLISHKALASLGYTLESNPIYTHKDIFIATDTFQSYLLNAFLPNNPLEDIRGLYDSLNKDVQKTLSFTFNTSTQNTPLFSLAYESSNDTQEFALASNENSSDDLNDSSDDTSSKNSTQKVADVGIYGDSIRIGSFELKNSSKLAANTIHFQSKYLLNQNGTIVARDNINANANTIDNISASIVGSEVNLNADTILIASGTNDTQASYSLPILGDLFSKKLKDIYTSSNTSLDALSSIQADSLHMNGNDVSIKGSQLKATQDININAHHLDISTTKLSNSYRDDAQSYHNVSHIASKLEGENINLTTSQDMNLLSASIYANNDILVSSKKDLSINTAQNFLASQTAITDYSSKFGGLSSTTTTTTTTDKSTTNIANNFIAHNVFMDSNKDINAYNLNIQSSNDVNMSTQGNLLLSNIADTSTHSAQTHSVTTGFDFSDKNGKYSMSYGKDTQDIFENTNQANHNNQAIQASSINLSASNEIAIESSDLKANADMSLHGANIAINSLEDISTHQRNEKNTSNRIGISISQADATNIAKALGKSTTRLISKKLADKIKGDTISEVQNIGVSVGFKHTQSENSLSKRSSLASASNFFAQNISINTNSHNDGEGSLEILGSNLEAKENVQLMANTLNIVAAQNSSSIAKSSSDKNFEAEVSMKIAGETNISAQASYHQSSQNSLEKTLTHSASHITSNNLSINTAQDTKIEGSRLDVAENTNIQAKSFDLLASKDSISKTSSQKSSSGLLKGSYGIDGLQGEFQYDSSTSSQSEFKTNHNASFLNTKNLFVATSQDMNMVGSTINAQDTKLDVQNLVVSASVDTQQNNSKASSNNVGVSGSYGALGADASLNYKHSNSSSSSSVVANNASFLNADNLSIKASKDTNIIGSQLNVAHNASIETNSLNVLGAQDSSVSTSKSNSFGIDAKAGFGVSSSKNIQLDMLNAHEKESLHTNQLASINASNLSIQTQGNTQIIGGNISTDDFKAQIKGDLNIASVQDTHTYSQANSQSNIKFNQKPNIDFDIGYTKGSYKSVHQQSAIKANNSLEIQVDKNTSLVGAFLEGGKDSSLKTQSLSYSDITNSSHLFSMQTGTKTRSINDAINNIVIPKDEISTTKATIGENINVNIQNPQEVSIQRGQPSHQKITDLIQNRNTISHKESIPTILYQDIQSLNETKNNFINLEKTIASSKNIVNVLSDGVKPLLHSSEKLLPSSHLKKEITQINNGIGLIKNSTDIATHIHNNGISKQDAKTALQKTFDYSKPLIDSLVEVGKNNATSLAKQLINSKQSKEEIFNQASKEIQKQSTQEIKNFMSSKF